ncbi:MAG: BTAD domain-containing putative transcriptional regulator [Candidatus Promineifilaceae bacterium]|nr:BTAD domain-containing putative transcriptional regulator [Candidatus Promineifilaceae bacterium]
MLKIRFLGRPPFVHASEPVTGFVSDKALALFAYLAMNEGFQSRAALAGLLWGEMTDKRARANLRHALHNLRQLFPDHLEVTRKQAAFIPDAPHWMDVTVFEQLAGQSHKLDALAEAAALYRDDFLAGLVVDGEAAFEAWRRAEQERLRLRLLQVLERLAEQYVAQGCWRDAEETSRRLLALEPWRESSYRRLMLLLARQGQYSTALAQYEQCREVLEEELGVAPMPETRALQRRILRLRASPRDNLPARPQPLLGRERELAEVGALLRDEAVRLVTISGLGGVGKTRLAAEIAAKQRPFFLDGVFWVPLVGVQEASHLPGHIATVLGVENVPGETPRERLLAFLHDKELLLVLDNVEHVLGQHTPSGPSFLNDILEAAPGVKLLVTSRERLQLRAEQFYPLSGLNYSEGKTLPEMEAAAAFQLFLHHARRVRPSFSLQSEHLEPLRALVQQVEGMPLALILAAGWVEVLGPKEIAAQIDQSLDFLEGTFRGVPARQQSMRAVFEGTWERLSEDEQALFVALSVFEGEFNLEAARAVAGASPHNLMRLAGRSLLNQEGEGRFVLHELLRQFAAERLQQTDQAEAVRDAHSAYYMELLAAQLPKLKGPEQLRALQAIGADFKNVRAAWRRADRKGNCDLSAASRSMFLYALMRVRYQDGIELLQVAEMDEEVSVPPVKEPARAYRLSGCALLAVAATRPVAPTSFEQLLHRDPAADPRLDEGVKKIQALEAALQTVSDSEPLAYARSALGILLAPSEKQEKAESLLKSALVYYRKQNAPYELALCLARLASFHMLRSEWEQVIAHRREALALLKGTDEHFLRSELLAGLASVLWQVEGPTRRVEEYYRQSAALRKQLGTQVLYASSLAEVAEVMLWREGADAEAAPLLEEALAVSETQKIPQVRLRLMLHVITLRLSEGRFEEALRLCRQRLPELPPDSLEASWTRLQSAVALLGLSRFAEATPFLKEYVSWTLQENKISYMTMAFPYLAFVLVARQEEERPVALLAHALCCSPLRGALAVDPLVRRFRAEMETRMGEKRFAAAWERGEKLDAKSAAVEALEELDSYR